MYKPEFAKKIYHALRFKAFQMFPEEVLKLQFKRRVGYDLNLENPRTFNEKLQWLKLYWRDARATTCSDKFAVRDYVKERGLEGILTKLHDCFANPSDLSFEDLPDSFVLKPNHTSGDVIICKDKKDYSSDFLVEKMDYWLKRNYYETSFEWVYEKIKPMILCEELLSDPIIDYKIMCFNGEPKCSFVCLERRTGMKINFYDLEWKKLPFFRLYPNAEYDVPVPERYEDMLEISRILAKDFPFVRVDLYEVNKKIFFGELTFFPGAGFEYFSPVEYDHKLGSYLTLPPKHSTRKG